MCFRRWCVAWGGLVLAAAVFVLSGCGGGGEPKNPVVTGFTPPSGFVGAEITITGKRFRTTPAENIVRFSGVQATVVSASDTQIVATVPAGTISGAITVTTPDGTGGAPTSFVVTRLLGGGIQGFPLSLTARVTTIAGAASAPGSADGTGSAARFNLPGAVTTDGFNLYIADTANNTIRKLVIASGQVTTIAGSPGIAGSQDGVGSGALFDGPAGITTDGTSLYITDFNNNTIRQLVLATGAVTTLAGVPGLPGIIDGVGTGGLFNGPFGITTDGNALYIADFNNNTIRQISLLTGRVTTLAGFPRMTGSLDGIGGAALFNGPAGIATDGDNLFITDFNNQTIRQLVLGNNQVTTIAGVRGLAGASDGIGALSLFNGPTGITTDGSSLYLTDQNNNTIRRMLLLTTQVTTIAGLAGTSGSADGTGTAARFLTPGGIVSDGTTLWIADTGNSTIRRIR